MRTVYPTIAVCLVFCIAACDRPSDEERELMEEIEERIEESQAPLERGVIEELGISTMLPADADVREMELDDGYYMSSMRFSARLEEAGEFDRVDMEEAISYQTEFTNETTEILEKESVEQGWYFTYTFENHLEETTYGFQSLINVNDKQLFCRGSASEEMGDDPEAVMEDLHEFCLGIEPA